MFYSPSVMHYLVVLTLVVGSFPLVPMNDRRSPCTQGECFWDLRDGSDTLGTLQIRGSNGSISDITSAAGWRLTFCDPEPTTLYIQLECADSNSHCDHLFQGAVLDTIVRTPEDCGAMPFARVAYYITNRGSRAALEGEALIIFLVLDMKFQEIPPTPNGTVSFTLLCLKSGNNSSIPSTLFQRGSVTSGAGVSSSTFRDTLQSLQNAMTFNQTLLLNLPPFEFSGKENLLNTSISCPSTSSPFIASVSLDVDGSIQADINLGVIAAGNIVPPQITEFALGFGVQGNINAQFDMSANLTGTVSSGDILLYQVGVPGFSFPGILDIGPEFKIMGKIDADFHLANVDAAVQIAYNMSEVAATFPQQGVLSGGNFNRRTSEVTVFASSDITDAGASVGVKAHLIPQVDIGVSAFGSAVSSSVFLNFDASMDLNVAADHSDAQACVDASTDLAVNIGAEDSFFGLFDQSTSEALYEKNFPLLQKCVGLHNSRRNDVLQDGDESDTSNTKWPYARSEDLVCPLGLSSQLNQLVNVVIPA